MSESTEPTDKTHDRARAHAITSEVGSVSLRTSGGRVHEEWHSSLKTLRKRMRALRQMADNSAVIGAILNSMIAFARGVTWSAEENEETSGTPEAARWAEYLESVMDDMDGSWEDMIAIQMWIELFGFSPNEVTYKRRLGEDPPPFVDDDGKLRSRKSSKHDDRLWGLHKIAIRSQESVEGWIWDEENNLIGMIQNAEFPNGRRERVKIPLDKMLLIREDSHLDNPEGRSPGRSAYRTSQGIEFAEDTELVGAERHMAGMPTMLGPPDILASTDAADVALVANWSKEMAKVRNDQRAGMVAPSSEDRKGKTGFEFRLMASEGTPIDFGPIISRKNSELAMVWAAEHMMVGVSGVGSFSLHSDKTRLFAQRIGGVLGIIADAIHHQVTTKLYKLNGVPPEFWARIVPSDIEKMDLAVWGPFVSALIAAGAIVPDEKVEHKARELADIEQPDATQGDMARPLAMPDATSVMEPPEMEPQPGETAA